MAILRSERKGCAETTLVPGISVITRHWVSDKPLDQQVRVDAAEGKVLDREEGEMHYEW